MQTKKIGADFKGLKSSMNIINLVSQKHFYIY